MVQNGINIVYLIGGDGTHRGIDALFQQIKKRKLEIVVAGIPKTIDNDIPIIDKSFGFTTSVQEATKAIESGEVEANSAENGLGLIKLMGRSAGHIALGATTSHRGVNCCLLPEFPIELYGDHGLLAWLEKRLATTNHCVMVVAEGMGDSIKDIKLENLGKDASGNVKMADVGLYLKELFINHFKEKKIPLTCKYIDPTYMIRSVPSNADDVELCGNLAQSVVHGTMAGFTGFTVGTINRKSAYIPLEYIVSQGTRILTREDRKYQRMLASTGQPSFTNDVKELTAVTLQKK